MAIEIPPPPIGNDKPPMGVAPRWVAQKIRAKDLMAALLRYIDSDHCIPMEWVEELHSLVDDLNRQREPKRRVATKLLPDGPGPLPLDALPWVPDGKHCPSCREEFFLWAHGRKVCSPEWREGDGLYMHGFMFAPRAKNKPSDLCATVVYADGEPQGFVPVAWRYPKWQEYKGEV